MSHPVMPSAIYVWLVPSEHVQEQPGSWRIRKWDTEPFPEANFKAAPPEGADTKDAERYRWLNDKFELLLELRDDTPIGGYRPPTRHVRVRCGEALDNWIDEKIEAERFAPQSGGSK